MNILNKLLAVFRPTLPTVEEPSELPSDLEKRLQAVSELNNRLDPRRVHATPRRNWRGLQFEALHRDIYHLLATVNDAMSAVSYRENPNQNVTRSRFYRDALTPTTLENYLVDHQGKVADTYLLFDQLKTAVDDLVLSIQRLKDTDQGSYEYYLRQTSHLFEELGLIITYYTKASLN